MTAISILCFVWILFCGINSGSTQPSNVRAVARNVIAVEGQEVDLRCITRPAYNVLRWTFNGTDLVDQGENLIEFRPVGLNQSLTILNAKTENSGRYSCHIVGADINADIRLTVTSVDCPPSIAGGLIWNGQRVGSTSLQRCSNLHENFHSGVFISRVCTIRGQWEDVDFSSCTMQLYSDPVIVAQGQVLSNNESYIDEFRDEVFRSYGTLNYEVIDYHIVTLPNNATMNTVSIAVISSVYRPDENESSGDEDGPGPVPLNQLTIDNATTVTQFIPDYQCSCDGNVRPTSKKQICVGPSVPPCVKTDMGYQCNHPIYVGNGVKCGLDSDSDGYPNVQLDCQNESCVQDICPNVYSIAPDGLQDGSVCGMGDPNLGGPGIDINGSAAVNFTGCPSEVDHIWFILWPRTANGFIATQKCNGVGLVGLVTRLCRENGTWGRISGIQNCYSIEFLRLQGSTINLRNFYFGDDDTDVYDQTQSHTLRDSLSVIRELRSLTNSSNPITPNDLIVANDIIRTIIRVEGYNEKYDYQTVVEDLSSVISNLLNTSNRVSYDELYYYHNSSDDQEEDDNEAELLLKNIDNFASVFRSLLINSFSSHQQSSQNFKFSYHNFNISFELPSDSDLESSGGIEFNVENSQVYIPYASIKHQMDTEGIQVPVVNYVAGNLASVLPARSLINTTVLEDQVVSSQISSQPISLPPDGYIKFTFKLDNPIDGQPKCVFWNFTLELGNDTGGWSEEGVFLDAENTNSTTITCVTNHLTSFAVLVDSHRTTSKISSSQARSLSIVSYIGCGVSIICLLATIIIIILFRNSVFKATHNMIHLNLSIALLLGLIAFVSGIETANDSKAGCISVTVLLHYFFIAAFCWMLCEGIIIYILLVKVFYNGFFKKLPFYIVLGWGMLQTHVMYFIYLV
ncbi:adhesion G protein-coupled receptor L3-like [Dysidea avara]|uniref:adhesion G protein-coupled receptor L3-like n=1 Tax=Dysidea avara TaxID=196820 RepID=UPI003319952F